MREMPWHMMDRAMLCNDSATLDNGRTPRSSSHYTDRINSLLLPDKDM